jgi:(2Fe-2S) ferredoxin
MNEMKQDEMKKTILVCCGTGCVANGSRKIFRELKLKLAEENRFQVMMFVKATGCNGWCEKGPLVKIMPDDITYCRVKLSDVEEIIEKTIKNGQLINRLLYRDPRTGNPPADIKDNFPQGGTHGYFHQAGIIDLTHQRKDLSPFAPCCAVRGKVFCTMFNDVGDINPSFYIIDYSRLSP